MPEILKTKKVKAFGNKGFTIQSLSPDKSSYLDDPLNIIGLVNFSGSVEQSEEALEGDDEGEYDVMFGNPLMDATANLRGLETKDIPRIYPAVGGTGRGVRIGEDLPAKYFGFMFRETQEVDKVKSENLYVFYTCRATNLPSLATASTSNTGVTPRPIPLSLRCIPTVYTKADGTKGRVLYDVFNSISDTYDFERFKDGIVKPVDITAPIPEPTPEP